MAKENKSTNDRSNREPHERRVNAGDQVGRDQISAGDISNSIVVMGSEGRIEVYAPYPPPAEQERPHLDFEPQLVFIESGVFFLGNDHGRPEEAPLHKVDLPAYSIGLYPVTNEQFARFIWDTGRPAASKILGWHGNEPPEEKLHHPVVGVTWYEALAFCLWLEDKSGRTYRLPNEAQWEKAARGEDGRLFPWGNDWQDGRCNTGSEITAVDAFPPQSFYGCYDMVGNSREWTLTAWGKKMQAPDRVFTYPWREDRRNNPDEPPTTWRVFRGGRFDEQSMYRCSARGAYLPEMPGPKSNRHSFRVVLLPR